MPGPNPPTPASPPERFGGTAVTRCGRVLSAFTRGTVRLPSRQLGRSEVGLLHRCGGRVEEGLKRPSMSLRGRFRDTCCRAGRTLIQPDSPTGCSRTLAPALGRTGACLRLRAGAVLYIFTKDAEASARTCEKGRRFAHANAAALGVSPALCSATGLWPEGTRGSGPSGRSATQWIVMMRAVSAGSCFGRVTTRTPCS